MTPQDFKDASDAIRDLRFIQAAAMTGLNGLSGEKKAKAYMKRLAELQSLLESEAMK